MKEKSLTHEELQSILETGGKLVFDTKSPFSQITAPPEMIFFAHHWDQPEIRGATGTAYVCRLGDPLDFDVYSLRRSSNKNDLGASIVAVNKGSIEYHHTDDLPEILKKQAPPWVIGKIKKC